MATVASPIAVPQRRKRKYVDNRLQGQLLRRMGIHWGALMISSTCALAIWIRLFEHPESSWGEVLGECFYRYLPFFFVSIVLVPAFILDSVKLTNRFAGPLHRLAVALEQVRQGSKFTPIHFRKRDFLHDLAEDLNAIMEVRGDDDGNVAVAKTTEDA